MTEPCDLSAVEARRLIGARRLSPVELLTSCRQRVEAVNHAVKAITDTIWPRALKEAKAAERAVRRGDDLQALHGLPLGVKDLDDAAGLINSYGSPIFARNRVAQDDPMVARCRAAGAIVVGKTNVPEFGAGANSNNAVYGPSGNPASPAGRRAVRRWRSPPACCRSRPARTAAARCAFPRPSAAWSGSGLRLAWCPPTGAARAGT